MANMAKETVFKDDLTGIVLGSDDTVCHEFSIDKDKWAIDLSPANFAKLQKALKPFTDKARPVVEEKKPAGTRTTRATSGTSENKVIRFFADKTMGTELADKRGPLPIEVKDAWAALTAADRKAWTDKYNN